MLASMKSHRGLCAGPLLAAGLLTLMNPDTQAAEPQAVKSLQWQVNRQERLEYLLYLPPGYDAKAGRRWPLMLFLHGAGERGTNVWQVAVHGPPKLVQQGTNFPFLIVSPQCPPDKNWDPDALFRLLDDATAHQAVDTNRIYLTGLSMGGYGTWRLGLAHPERFAAIAPICGGASLIDAILVSPDKAAALKALPIWAFHGVKDPVVPVEESQRLVAALQKRGCAEVKLTLYPEAQHDSWTQTYGDPAFYEWLLQHERATPGRPQ